MNTLWNDDDWKTEADTFIELQMVLKEINIELCEEKIDVNWECIEIAGDAVVIIDENRKQYYLAIIDIGFERQRTEVRSVIQKLEQKKIHYIIYSNNP